jgi:hypothetical protein
MGYSGLTGVAEFFGQERAHQLIGTELASNVVRLVEREGWRLAKAWAQSRLVHADYKPCSQGRRVSARLPPPIDRKTPAVPGWSAQRG